MIKSAKPKIKSIVLTRLLKIKVISSTRAKNIVWFSKGKKTKKRK